ncbi:MAG: hypothetical protein AVDCRST_MAG42-2019, partial [uncultured Chthoniobacterales bacterium]
VLRRVLRRSACESGGIPPHSKTLSRRSNTRRRLRFGVRRYSAAFRAYAV